MKSVESLRLLMILLDVLGSILEVVDDIRSVTRFLLNGIKQLIQGKVGLIIVRNCQKEEKDQFLIKEKATANHSFEDAP